MRLRTTRLLNSLRLSRIPSSIFESEQSVLPAYLLLFSHHGDGVEAGSYPSVVLIEPM